MRITDFELQKATGTYWDDIVERVAEKDAEIAGLKDQMKMSDADKQDLVDAHAAELQTANEQTDIAAKAQAVAEADAQALKDSLVNASTPEELADIKAEAAKSAEQKQRETLTQQITDLQAQLDALGK